ncbi:MAG: insulinase family protein [candidate division KSB1 bacterium]|nr:insulinase family protein [candidate division KSB1 bacterium]MDZ7273772.1 insulinase family protein [candidate division KSB1 bacterium]MDZ7285928.1 insulinase family protein [candidate division KSB1 bacterium]MDZ7298960.1 insulinase family protein [candidate division KSB1 bacterium]MDZ7308601.1 insulinase family protein [candidate division KSB1 bacterium]
MKNSGIRFPEFTKHLLPNGMTILLWEDHRLPLLAFEVLLKIGATADPPGKEGLAAITLSLLRKGTRRRSARQFAETLDSVGGRFSTDQAIDCGLLSLEVLREDWQLGLTLLAEALRQPVFPREEFDKKIEQAIAGWRQARDNPANVIEQYFNSFLFAGHPYGRSELGTETSLASLSLAEVVAFHQRYYGPEQVILAIAGDCNSSEVLAKIHELFADWQPGAAVVPVPAPPQKWSHSRVLLVDKPDEQQVYFCLGNVGAAYNCPDYAGLDVLETILGGRFTSWLNAALRIQAGLTYSASVFSSRHLLPGALMVASDTAVAAAGRALEICLAQMRRLHDHQLDEATLQSTVNYIRGQYPANFETLEQLAGLACDLEFYGVGPAMVNTYFDRLAALTVAELERLAREYFPREAFAFVLAGPAKKLRKVAAHFGPVEEIKLSDPGFYSPA